ncbi:hypothetical protein COHA_000689 [Chlorella ohadii]|uniref:Uncharacterized protein n=1 Tax=Chlorella ohadii TaxID=2649997 RepID=A0AAD5E0K3_9CHLO|nr:hypothetical protein COHA_000689 [Chlorella ohadii]
MFAGVDINARLPHTWGAATAYALPAGLVLDVELPARWPFDGHTPLRTALVMGSLRTAEALLAAGARQKPAWDALRRIATAQPGEEGLQRMRAAAALLLAHGLPAEEGAVWEAHRVAAELAWPQRQADPEDPWVLSRLLQAHLQAGSGGGEGALGAVVHVLETAINNLDLPAFRAWLPAPALGTLGGPGLLEFLHALGERMVYWAPGLPSAYAEQTMLATLDRFSAALQQAVAQQRRSPSRGIWGGSGRSDSLVANAACAGSAHVLERLLAAGCVINVHALREAKPGELRQMRINIENSGDWEHIWRTGLYAKPEDMLYPELGLNMLNAAQAQAWSPGTHRWWPPHFRSAVRTLLLVAQRGMDLTAAAAAGPPQGAAGTRRTRQTARREAAAAAAVPAQLLGSLERELLLSIVAAAAYPLSAWDWHSFSSAGDYYTRPYEGSDSD